MEKEKGVSRDEFDAFAKEVTDAICLLKTQAGAPKNVEVSFYRCTEEGCGYTTDDLGAYIEHTVDERLKGHRSPTPTEEEEEIYEATQPSRRHMRAEDFLDCPECAPRFEKTLFEMGWEKPEPKRESALSL